MTEKKTDEAKTAGVPRPAPSPTASAGEAIPLSRLPLTVRRLLQSTPPREWYRIKAVRAKYEETVELTHLVPVLDYLLDMAPARCISQMRKAALTPQAIDDAFRRVRDAINGLKDSCRHIAELAHLEIRAWQDKNSPPAAAAGPRALAPPPAAP